MNDLRTAAQQALEFLDAEFGWSPGEAPRIDNLRAALAQQDEPVQQVKTCAWRDNLDAIYETECGNLHIVNDGTLEENGMKYCCYCGKEIKDESPT
jgi:hypothetical protein